MMWPKSISVIFQYQVTIIRKACVYSRMKVNCYYWCTGQVGLRVGSWPSNLTNAGSPPSEFDYTSCMILLKNVEYILDWH